MDKRVSMLNVAWGQPEYSHFGTDEFLRFAQLVGAQPQICLNMGSGTVRGSRRLDQVCQCPMGRQAQGPCLGAGQ